ncbi:MAG: hypothetical protein KC944_23295 [Candidatus Omnitrophica bacterium]|nr:hypothetical protein [Candidatus Omnitrophota bacterium]
MSIGRDVISDVGKALPFVTCFVLLGVFGWCAGWMVILLLHGADASKKPSASGRMRTIATAIYELEAAKEITSTTQDFSSDSVFGSVEDVFPDLATIIPPQGYEDLLTDIHNPSGDFYRAAAWKHTYFLISVGPDGKLDVTEEQIKEAFENNSIVDMARLKWPYSPTNGSISSGDIFRVEQ